MGNTSSDLKAARDGLQEMMRLHDEGASDKPEFAHVSKKNALRKRHVRFVKEALKHMSQKDMSKKAVERDGHVAEIKNDIKLVTKACKLKYESGQSPKDIATALNTIPARVTEVLQNFPEGPGTNRDGKPVPGYKPQLKDWRKTGINKWNTIK